MKYNNNINCIPISSNFSGQRIDNFLLRYLKGMSKNLVYCLIRKNKIKINNQSISFQYRLKEGDILSIPFVKETRKNNINIFSAYSRTISILYNSILYEDDDLLIINKPSGIAVHAGSKLNFGVIEILRASRSYNLFLELVHRLDRYTSGILLIAKKRVILLELQKQLVLQKIHKKYLALVQGKLHAKVNIVNIPLFKGIFTRHDVHHVMQDNLLFGSPAKTIFLIKEKFDIATLVIAMPITGRTHQIRAHAKYIGHPIACDNLYGNKDFNMKLCKYGLDRLFLHAYSLCFVHPGTQKILCVNAPLDESLYEFLYFLRVYKK